MIRGGDDVEPAVLRPARRLDGVRGRVRPRPVPACPIRPRLTPKLSDVRSTRPILAAPDRSVDAGSRWAYSAFGDMAALTIGYAAMLEQFGPQEVVGYQVLAEQNGFSGCMAADHFQPWVPQQGQASFVWNVLAAVGERTQGDLGPGVTCPSFRFHPAIVAQAAATLEAMYPGRTWLGVGSGEALNEHVIAGYWPEAGERSLRMFEAIEVIKKLFDASLAGKDVKHDGRFFQMETSRLWTMPDHAAAGARRHRRAGQRQEDGPVRRRDHHRRRAAGEDRRPVRQVRGGRARGGQGPGRHAEGAAAAPLVGRDGRSRRSRTPSGSGPTAA